MRCIVVTPEATVVDQQASFVVVPLYDGEYGIAAGHSPVIARLGYGEMRITGDEQPSHYYIDGGFIQVVDNVVTVLTGRAMPAGRVDAQAARDELRQAMQRPTNTDEQLQLRHRAELRARAQLRVARRAAGQSS